MATPIKNLIQEYLSRFKQENDRAQVINRLTGEIVDADTAGCIRLKYCTGRQIVFCATSSTAAYNFNLQKEKLLKKIQSELPAVEKITIELNQ